MAILIFGVWVGPSLPPPPLPPPSPPPFLRNVNLLQSNAMEDDNRHQDGRIAPPFLDNSSRPNQESIHVRDHNQESIHNRDQEQHERRFERPVPVLEPTVLTYNDPWSIKKTLTKSDVNDLCRLMLKTTAVREHILGKWDNERRRAFSETEQGVRVDVWDADTATVHQVAFKRWKSSGSFVFNNNWVTQFVKRRGLKEGDKIGLRWDSQESRFCFCVLSWAPRC